MQADETPEQTAINLFIPLIPGKKTKTKHQNNNNNKKPPWKMNVGCNFTS